MAPRTDPTTARPNGIGARGKGASGGGVSQPPTDGEVTPFRQRLREWVESTPIQRAIVVVIVINAVVLGLETSSGVMASFGSTLIAIDRVCLAIFVVELLIKMYAFGWRFFTSAWNIFDFLVVGIALVPASGPLAVLRALRVLRVLRLVSTMPRLRFVVEALITAVPGIMSIGALLLLVFYVAAVMATSLFGPTFPQWFGSVGDSLYSLFQIMTLESWSMGIVRPVMEVHPWAWAFFVPFILISAFTVLNLFIAVIVDSMQSVKEGHLPPHDEEPVALGSQAASQTEALEERVDHLQAQLDEALVLLRRLNSRD